MASSPEQLYSLKPVVDALRDRGVRIRLAVPSAISELASQYLDVSVREVLALRPGFPVRRSLRHAAGAVLARLYVFARVPRNFSVMYRRLRSTPGLGERLLSWVPAVNPRQVNASYHRLFASWLPSVFKNDVVLASTPVAYPHLLCARDVRVYTIIDSWDHSFKMPFFHEPEETYAWNSALARAVHDYQGIRVPRSIYPLRFRYIGELEREKPHGFSTAITNTVYRSDLDALGNDSFICYVATTSARNPVAFAGEVELVDDILKYCRDNKLRLYIKPKPNGIQGEFEKFEGSEGVQVGPYGTGVSNLQLLDAEYHRYRYTLLKRARLIVNVGTTFGLEASLVGAPILQLRLDAHSRFGLFQELSNNPHVVKYLLADRPVRTYDGSTQSLKSAFDDALHSSLARDYSSELREWIAEGHDLQASIDSVVDALVAELRHTRS